MKVIIYGATEAAYLIANKLYIEHDITVISEAEELPDAFNKLDLSFVQGNPSSTKVLKAAGIESTDVFIAASPVDERNIVACWNAGKFADVQTLCFVSKFEYFRDNEGFHIDAGIDYIIWPEKLLTQEIFRVITIPEAVDAEEFAGGKVNLLEYKIKNSSKLVSKQIKNCHFPQNTLILGISREGQLFIPTGSSVIQADDKLLFMGFRRNLEELYREYIDEKSSQIRSVTIIGGGNVGFMLAEMLESLKIKTKIIEKNYERCEYLSENLKESLVLNADGTDIELLESEDIGNSDIAVCVTNNDEKNLLCSLLVKQLGVKKVITRVNSVANASLFEKVGVDVALSPLQSAIDEVNNKFIETDINILATVERGQGEVFETTIAENFKSIELMNMKFPANAIVATIKRGHKILIPKGDTLIRANDILFVFTTTDNAPVIKDFFKNEKYYEI